VPKSFIIIIIVYEISTVCISNCT